MAGRIRAPDAPPPRPVRRPKRRAEEATDDSRRVRALEKELHVLQTKVRECERELECLYGLADLIERLGPDLKRILGELVEMLPAAWRYPEIAQARITLDDLDVTSRGFRQSRWRQVALLRVGGLEVGQIEVLYVREPQRTPRGHSPTPSVGSSMPLRSDSGAPRSASRRRASSRWSARPCGTATSPCTRCSPR